MNIRQFLGRALYNLLGKHMPLSDSRRSMGSKRVRALCGKLILEHCGRNVNIERGAQFSSGVRLGDNSGIGINARLEAHVTIGNDVMMGPECMIFTANHSFSRTDIPMRLQGYDAPRSVVIEDDVWIGARVIILPGVRVGRGSIIGAGSVVTHDIPPYSIAAGNPARVIRSRKDI